MKAEEIYPWLAKVTSVVCHYAHLKHEGRIEDYNILAVKIVNGFAEVDVEVKGKEVPSAQHFIGSIRIRERRI